MSIGKFLGGTVIATPAVGGGGYVIYKEVTKEETTSDPTTNPTNNEVQTTSPSTGGLDTTKTVEPKGDASELSAGNAGATQQGTTVGSTPAVETQEGKNEQPGVSTPNPESGSGLSGGSNSAGQ